MPHIDKHPPGAFCGIELSTTTTMENVDRMAILADPQRGLCSQSSRRYDTTDAFSTRSDLRTPRSRANWLPRNTSEHVIPSVYGGSGRRP